ncbi:MAG: CvpA family protein [Clostridia bacterium]|nr:CvpA family protein [Clostridia bacterium]
MSWILDVLLIAIVLGTLVYYTHRGFVKAVLGFGRTLLSFLLAMLLGPKLGGVIATKLIGNKIADRVYNLLVSFFDKQTESFDLSELFDKMPEAFVSLVERFGGNMAELEAKYGDLTAATRENLTDLSQTIAAPITTVISNLFGYLIVFLVAFVLLILFTGVLSKIFELPVLKQINHLLGFVLGLLFAVLNAFIFCFIGAYLLKFIGAASGKFVAEELIEGTRLFQLIANIKLF